MIVNIKSKRIIIKNFTLKNIDKSYISWFNGKNENLKFSRHFEKIYQRNVLIKKFFNSNSNSIFLGIFEKINHNLIGSMIIKKELKGYRYNIGILIGEKKYLSKGFAYESIKLFINFVFKKTKCKFINFGTNIKNLPMIKLAKKFNVSKKLGKHRNSIIFELRKYN